MESRDFIDELIREAEQKEEQQSLAYYDMLIVDIINEQKRINEINDQTKREIELINQWKDSMITKHLDRIEFLETKLHAFIVESNVKTIDLPHGKLQIRKRPDKVEVIDVDTFIISAKSEMLKAIPESYKPDLNGIKNYIKRTGIVPEGVKFTEGQDSFSLSLKILEV
ncbi:MAG: host-nuclease inhibitor Gam family protein [Melioribacteraceae bacterium]|nr:MAG: host-nuclease inhibitor Gam family protein [Melioribacteraceae bacterium]